MRLPRITTRRLMALVAVATIVGALVVHTRRTTEAERISGARAVAIEGLRTQVARLQMQLRELSACRDEERMRWERSRLVLDQQIGRARDALQHGLHHGKAGRTAAIRIARRDAETFYGELTEYDELKASLESDGWHIDIVDSRPLVAGGGLHYLIDRETGKIKSVDIEQ